MSKTMKKSSGTTAHQSRRAFMKKAVLGAGATAALGTTGVGLTAQEADAAIAIPPEFEAAGRRR